MSQKPNIIFILNDHQAYHGHGRAAGGPEIKRPNFERLASEGVKFTRAYSASPLCSPARRSMLTGLYPHNHGEIVNNTNHPWDRETYLNLLAKEGYQNYYFGKWHAGRGTAYDQHCKGFSYKSYGNPYTKPEYKKYLKRKNLPKFQVRLKELFWKPKGFISRFYGLKKGKKFTPKRPWCNEHAIGPILTPKETHESFFLANLACEKLTELANEGNSQPFHLRVDFWGPHQPYYATQEYLDLYDPKQIPEYPSYRDNLEDKPDAYRVDYNYPMSKDHELIVPNPMDWSEWQKILRYNYAQQSLIDDAGGLILNKLDELGLTDETLVIWSTDHGDGVGCHGGHFDKAWYMPEEIVRIPMAIRYPKRIDPHQIKKDLVSNMDIPCTILDAAGTQFNNPVNGCSLLPLCSNEQIDWKGDLMCETHGHISPHLGRLVVTDRYKYVWNEGDLDELYDLDQDPFEMKNLINSESHISILEDMKQRLIRWREDTGDVIERDLIKRKLRGWSHGLKKKWQKLRKF